LRNTQYKKVLNENWEQVKDLLDQVLQVEVSERRNFLDQSGINGEIRAEVESLIAFETEAENLMNLSAIEFSKDFFSEEDDSSALLGQQIGVYRIIREIGYGGMGAVYLGERIDGKFEQKVAIKLLKREFNTARLRQSFKRESEIQSKLHHPNIAQLLDAGTTDDGIPFLAMEFVEGETIDKFCEDNDLPLISRLKVFNKVCEAVSYAHQNLIIHRDLKPSNILVTKDGIPKLLDFGISKILSDEQSEEKTFTMLGAMTPDYASPEQIRGEKMTTATDIYSLGVVLYKILTGRLPYDLKDKTNGNLLKIITENEPSIPSSQNTNPQSAIRNPQLKGDLDNIILKALRKEPARRYQTVEQFSTDIWRHLDGLPVLARPATIKYRANKFFQRNRIAVIAASLIFISLIAGIAVATRQTGIAREQARIAAESQNFAIAEAEKAKAEQTKAEKITKFMSKIIGYANPKWYSEGAKLGKDARVIDAILDLGDKIDVEFADEPDVAAELHHKFTEVIGNNGGSLPPEEQKARRLFHARRALELRKQFYGERHELVAKDMVYLYWAREFDADKDQASYLMSAIIMIRETNPKNLNLPYMLEEYTARLILPGEDKYHEQYRIAVVPPTNESRYEIAEKMLRESLPVFRHHYKTDNSAIYGAECNLAYALVMQENRKDKDFDEHFAICKQFGNVVKSEAGVKAFQSTIELIEKALAEKNRAF
jgi:serine/threonine protein kinase